MIASGTLPDYASAVFPVSKVDPAIYLTDEGYKPKNAEDAFIYETCILSNLVV
jgi:hypothetical protein